jgi:ribosomal protein S25
MARQRKDGKLSAVPKPELIMLLALKQCHWQLVAADLLYKGKDLYSGLRQLGATKEVDSTRQKVWKKLDFRLRQKAQQACAVADEKKSKKKKDDEEEKEEKSGQEVLVKEPMIQNIVDFIQTRLIRLCPPYEQNAHLWVLLRAIDRFLTAQRAFVNLRLAKGDAALALLGQELRKLSL